MSATTASALCHCSCSSACTNCAQTRLLRDDCACWSCHQGIRGCWCQFVSSTIELYQGFALHPQLHLRILLEDSDSPRFTDTIKASNGSVISATLPGTWTWIMQPTGKTGAPPTPPTSHSRLITSSRTRPCTTPTCASALPRRARAAHTRALFAQAKYPPANGGCRPRVADRTLPESSCP
jgi:hypothetical protein